MDVAGAEFATAPFTCWEFRGRLFVDFSKSTTWRLSCLVAQSFLKGAGPGQPHSEVQPGEDLGQGLEDLLRAQVGGIRHQADTSPEKVGFILPANWIGCKKYNFWLLISLPDKL